MLRFLAIGCGLIVLIIAMIGGAAVWFGPQLWDMAKEAMAAEQERQQLAERWSPPADDAPAEVVFPAQLENYKREAADDDAKVPELQLDLPGKHAVYRHGASRIDAYVFPITRVERDGVLHRLEHAQGGGTRTWTKVDLGDAYGRAYLSSTAQKQNHLWFTKGRLVLFRTSDEADCEGLVKAFFRAAAARMPAGNRARLAASSVR